MGKDAFRIRLQVESTIEPNDKLKKFIEEHEGKTVELDDDTKENFFDMMRKTKVELTFGKEVL